MQSTKALATFILALLAACSRDARIDEPSCEALDLKAVKLAGQQKLMEAAEIYDKAIKQCPPDPSRNTSRGVIAAALGDKVKAEQLINEAIEIAERQGNICRADMSRGELAVVRGGAKLTVPPKSCKSAT